MPKIEFVKVERDCQYNLEIPAKSKKRRIIDYTVLIDGERRAVIKELSLKSGWRLVDIFDNTIWQKPSNPNNFHKHDIRFYSPERFAQDIQQYLDRIPTLADIERMQQEKAETLEREKRNQQARQWTQRLRDNALELYEIVKSFEGTLGERARRVIDAIDKEEVSNAEEA